FAGPWGSGGSTPPVEARSVHPVHALILRHQKAPLFRSPSVRARDKPPSHTLDSRDRIGTQLAAPAALAALTEVERVDEVHQRLDMFGQIRGEGGLEIALVGMLRAHPRACEIRGADERDATIDDHCLGVQARAHDPLEELRLEQLGLGVEVLAKARARLFGVKEANR